MAANVFALLHEIARDCRPEAGIGDVMRGIGRDGAVAAGELVFALRPGLDTGETAGDGELDGLVVADLEMQEG